MDYPQYIEQLDRFMRREATEEEIGQLLAWLRTEKPGADILRLYRQRWNEIGTGASLDPETQERMYRKLKTQLHSHPDAPRKNKKTGWATRWMRVAAVAVLLIAVGVGAHLYTCNSLLSDRPYEVVADHGQRAGVTLPDGTKVWLNSHSKLTYKNDFGVTQRNVSLSGEAYFEVAKDPKRRFVVDARGIKIEALGTTFNIKAYCEDPSVVATLLSGSVRVSTSSETAVLKKGEQAVVNNNGGKLTVHSPDRVEYAGMWRSDELAFSGHTLEQIARELARMYNVKIVFENENIKKTRFSGIIQNNSLDNVIEIISLTAAIEYRTQGDTVVLREKVKNEN